MKTAIILTIIAAFFAAQNEPTYFTQVCAVVTGLAALYCIARNDKQVTNKK